MSVRNSCFLKSEPGEGVTMLHSAIHPSFKDKKSSILADENPLVLSKLNPVRAPRATNVASPESQSIKKKETPAKDVKQEPETDWADKTPDSNTLECHQDPAEVRAVPTDVGGATIRSLQGGVEFEIPLGTPTALSIVGVNSNAPLEPSQDQHELSTEEIHRIFVDLKREASIIQERLTVPISGTEAAKLLSVLISKIDAQNGTFIENRIGNTDDNAGKPSSLPTSRDAIRAVISEATQRFKHSVKSHRPPKRPYKVEKFKTTMRPPVSKSRSDIRSPGTQEPEHYLPLPVSLVLSQAPIPSSVQSVPVLTATSTSTASTSTASTGASASAASSLAVSSLSASSHVATSLASSGPPGPSGSYTYHPNYYGSGVAPHDYTPYTTAYSHYPQNAFPHQFAPGSMPVQTAPHYSQYIPAPPPGYPVPVTGWNSPLNQISPGSTPNWQQFLAESPSHSPSGLFGGSPQVPGLPSFGVQLVPPQGPPVQMMRDQTGQPRPGRIQEMHAYQANQTRYPYLHHSEPLGVKKHEDYDGVWNNKRQVNFSGGDLEIKCQQCGATSTPEWRRGPEGQRTLCNACGLFHAKIARRQGEEAAVRLLRERRPVCP